jgi:protein-disulfide isomerase
MKAIAMCVLAAGAVAGAESRLVEGNPKSEVRVVIYEDLQCSDCAHFRAMLDNELLPKYAATVRFEHRDFPLAKHDWARRAAVAARFIERTGGTAMGIRFRCETLKNRLKVSSDGLEKWLTTFARKEGLDGKAVLAGLREATLEEAVEKDYQEGVARGIAKTPTVLVNGQPFIETFTVEEITAAIEGQLQ